MEAKLTFTELKQLNLPNIDKEILAFWDAENIFQKTILERQDATPFIFYEGPPSANGTPGIHHVLSRTLKDIFCRFRTMDGYLVERKGGWDTHGLPVELGVEKLLGITKEDIGKTITVEEYNSICRREVMKYKDQWEEVTRIMGYWVDMEKPYVTFENNYIESLWQLLQKLHAKGLLYKGYTIQPFSPAAGTGLSSHELNMPGAYREVKDTTIVAQFKATGAEAEKLLGVTAEREVFFLAWTTTPWTLPSNTALAVGRKIVYVQVRTLNPYTGKPVEVVLAKDRLYAYFKEEQKGQPLEQHEGWNKHLPWEPVAEFSGEALSGLRYEQLLPYAQPESGDAFRVVTADFVSTEDGTGIVHIAPSFGADDFRTAQQNGIGSLTLVDRQGRFSEDAGELAGRYVKNYTDDPEWENPDVFIAVKLKEENRAFRVEKYEHNYPHCWRTDKPVIYYPLDSWFIRTTAVKDRLLELNRTINWKPRSTGEGRFAQWLENLVDWNLSRSRYWGTPLPIWRTADGTEEICIGSVKQLTEEFSKAKEAGLNTDSDLKLVNGLLDIDLHKPYVDRIVLVSATGQPMYREADLIDVWFDSGAMPYAQWHWPFENEETFRRSFPADFIAEGVDQTRGWFFTLHVLGTMLFDSVAYRNVVSNGLVLDKAGNKMSKRLGNGVDPFDTIYKYGADAVRWYMITNAQPWDNLKFDFDGITEVQRKFFGTLFNTCSFFGLYANVDAWRPGKDNISISDRPELDRWILSLLHSLTRDVRQAYESYEPTRAGRLIELFVTEHLSNWYVRLSRRRFWKGELSADKNAAYHTLYTCLHTIARLMAPVSPFFAEFLYRQLRVQEFLGDAASVHLSAFPVADQAVIDSDLEETMQLAQDLSSTILALRKKVNIKVRQPLRKAMIPVLQEDVRDKIRHISDLVLAETNIKELSLMEDTAGVVTRKVKPDFKKLGPLLGAHMKEAATMLGSLSQERIAELERWSQITLEIAGKEFVIPADHVEIVSEDIPGWLVANAGNLTVALDIQLTPELVAEGNAREFVSRMQKLRKDSQLEITDRIVVEVVADKDLWDSLLDFKNYICTEILADELVSAVDNQDFVKLEINEREIRARVIKTEAYGKK